MNVNIGCHSFAGEREREREKKKGKEKGSKSFSVLKKTQKSCFDLLFKISNKTNQNTYYLILDLYHKTIITLNKIN
jgi:hypothetical protein